MAVGAALGVAVGVVSGVPVAVGIGVAPGMGAVAGAMVIVTALPASGTMVGVDVAGGAAHAVNPTSSARPIANGRQF
jgi:hypothetical protein